MTTLEPSAAAQRDVAVILETAAQQLSPDSPVLALLCHLHSTLGRGAEAVLLQLDQELTPNQAASIIGISRPHLLSFMDAGALAFHRVGTHRRIKVVDLLDFSERRQAARQTLTELHNDAPAADTRHLHARAPLSDEALADLDSL
nr:helix-turn-helix domain-containing protein [Cellulomonas denverensis]